MTITCNFVRILLSFISFVFIACNIPLKNEEQKVEAIRQIDLDSLSDQAIIQELINDSVLSDSIFAWHFDRKAFIPRQRHPANRDSLSLEETIEHINKNKFFGKVQLKLHGVSNDTVYIKIPEAKFLTEKVGFDLAQDFLSTTTFILTDLDGINFVNFDFESGNKIESGVYSKDFYYRNSIIRSGEKMEMDFIETNSIRPKILYLDKKGFISETAGMKSLVQTGFQMNFNFDSLDRAFQLSEKLEINKYALVLDSLLDKFPESIIRKGNCLILKTKNNKKNICRDTIDQDMKSRSWYELRGFNFDYLVLREMGYEYELYYLYNPKTFNLFAMEGKPRFSENNIYVFGILDYSDYNAGRFEIFDLKRPSRTFTFISWPLEEVYKFKDTFYFKVRSVRFNSYFQYFKIDFSKEFVH